MNSGDTYTWVNNMMITNVIWSYSSIINIFCEENLISTLGNLSIHMLVSFFVANSRACDSMFSQFVVYALLLSKLYTNVFPNTMICISCMLYAAFHVEWSPLRVCSLSKKRINNNNNSL